MTDKGEDSVDRTDSKEWRVTMPEGIDPTRALMGELAISSMVRALGWDVREVKRPTETELTPEQITAVSKEHFGHERYGILANQWLDGVRHSATAGLFRFRDVYFVEFQESSFGFQYPGVTSQVQTERDFPLRDEVRQAARVGIDSLHLPFTQLYSTRSRFHTVRPINGDLEGVFLPDKLTKERLALFLERPPFARRSKQRTAASDHQMHGALGRMIDVLCLAAGVKESVDPKDTEPRYGQIPMKEFFEYAQRQGLTPGIIKGLRDRIEWGFRAQLIDLAPESWGEVVFDGDLRIPYFTSYERMFSQEHWELSTATLADILKSYKRPDPRLVEFLDIFAHASDHES